MPGSKLYPLHQWFYASGWKQRFADRGRIVDKDSLRVSGGLVYAFCRDEKIQVPLDGLHIATIPWSLVPAEQHQWISLSEFTSRLVWYVGSADAITAASLHLDAVRKCLVTMSAPQEAILSASLG